MIINAHGTDRITGATQMDRSVEEIPLQAAGVDDLSLKATCCPLAAGCRYFPLLVLPSSKVVLSLCHISISAEHLQVDL